MEDITIILNQTEVRTFSMVFLIFLFWTVWHALSKTWILWNQEPLYNNKVLEYVAESFDMYLM